MSYDPSEDFEKFVREEAQKALAEQLKGTNPNPPTTPSAPEPLKVKIAGQEFTFKDTDELSSAMEKTLMQARQELEAARTPKPEPVGVKGDDAPDWSTDSFIEKFTKDPRQALEYALQDMLGVEKPIDFLKEKAAETEMIKRTISAEQFKQKHPEFPWESLQAAQYVEKVREEMGLPYDTKGLEAAYYVALNNDMNFRGLVQQKYNAISQNQVQSHPHGHEEAPNFSRPTPQPINSAQNWNGGMNFNPGVNPYLMAPPTVGRTSHEPSPSQNINYDELSPEQIEKIFANLPRR